MPGPEDGRSLLVLGFVPGAASDAPVVAREAGALFRRVHAVRLPGWGMVAAGSSGTAAGRHNSWGDHLRTDLDGVDRIVRAGVLDAEVALTARRMVLADGGPTAYAGPGVLLHRDLKVQHLFGLGARSGERLTAVIDWGFVGVGDPEVDLARLSMAGAHVFHAFLEGYGVERDADLDRRLARYRLWWDLSTLVYEHDAGGDFFDPYRRRVAADVALLAGRGRGGHRPEAAVT